MRDLKCPVCKNQKSCAIMGIGEYAIEKCGMFSPVDKLIRIRADRIRAMSDEEMAKTFANYVSCHDCPIPYCKARFTMERLGCIGNWLDWLRQEVTVDGHI